MMLRPLRRRYFEAPDILFRYTAGAPGLTTTRSTPATYRDRTGIVRTAAPGVLRLDWQDGRPYALVEPGATAIMLDSVFERGDFVRWKQQLQGGGDDSPRAAFEPAPDGAFGAHVCVLETIGDGGRPGLYQPGESLGLEPGDQVSARVRWRRTSGTGALRLRWGGTSDHTILDGPTGPWIESVVTDRVVEGSSANWILEPETVTGAARFELDYWQLERGPISTSLIPTLDAPATRDRDLVSTDYAHPPGSMAVYMAGISAGGDQGMIGTAGARLLQIGSGTSVAARSLILRAWPPDDVALATIGSGQGSASSSAPAIPVGAEYQRLVLLDADGATAQARVRLLQRHRETPGVGPWIDASGSWSSWLDVSELLALGWESPHLTIGNVREGTRAGRLQLSDMLALDLRGRDVEAVTIDAVTRRFGL